MPWEKYGDYPKRLWAYATKHRDIHGKTLQQLDRYFRELLRPVVNHRTHKKKPAIAPYLSSLKRPLIFQDLSFIPGKPLYLSIIP
jgi:hypothetical protein